MRQLGRWQPTAGPTPQQGYDAGQTMIAEIRAALSEEFQPESASSLLRGSDGEE